MSTLGIAKLADSVKSLMGSCISAEVATVSAAGLPIDTPVFAFKASEGARIDIATGLAHPANAERAWRSPVAAIAAVRDSDIQANLDRCIAGTIAYYVSYSSGNSTGANARVNGGQIQGVN
jgi:hypothetical protein